MKKKIILSLATPFLALSFLLATPSCAKLPFEKNVYNTLVRYGYDESYDTFLSFINGKNKTNLLTGTYTPVSSIGKDGDFYICVTNFDYYQKTEGRWHLKGNLSGLATSTIDEYNEIYAGNDNPIDTEGNSGDLYINCTTGNVYQKIDNHWVIIGSIPDGCGDSGTTAYQRYVETHPEYNYSEGRWMNDMFNGTILEAERHTITFDSNGGTFVKNQYVVHGNKIDEPNPKLKGWLVDNWFYNGEPWNFDTQACIEDMHLTAEWIKDENTLMISEVCSKNRYSYSDYYGETPDYIELYNGTKSSINLAKYTITSKNKTYTFPSITINAKSFLMIIADGRNEITPNNEVHVPFTLSQPKGGKIILNDNNGINVDSLSFPDLKDDISFGCLNGHYSMLKASGNKKNEEVFIDNVTLETPAFSKKSGKYEESFYLDITSKDNYEIHYTLDSSEPTMSSPIYDESIFVNDISDSPNVIASRSDVSATDNQYTPTEAVRKCTVIKAICSDDEGHVSPVVTASYWIDQNDFLVEDTPLLSLSTDFENLFDYEKGIYCNGKIFDDYKNSDKFDSSLTYWYMPANYNQRGYEWERIGDLTYIDENNNLSCEQRTGIRIHGTSSRAFNKKGFSLFSRFNYDKNNTFSYRFNNQKCESFILRGSQSSGNYISTDVINQYIAEQSGLNIQTQSFTGTYLYLNGEYWGFYYITTKYDARFLEEEYGASSPIMFKNGSLEEGHVTFSNEIPAFINRVGLNSILVEENFKYIEDTIDIENYIDYALIQLFLSNNDWAFNLNCVVWRESEIKNAHYLDGKYRFLLMDTDWGGGTSKTPDFDVLTPGYISYNRTFKLLFELTKIEKYKNIVLQKVDKMCEKLDYERIEDNIVSIVENNRKQLLQSHYRYSGIDRTNRINSIIYQNKIFIRSRNAYFKAQVMENI